MFQLTRSSVGLALALALGMAVPASAGLVGYWPFDEGEGAVAVDAGPHGIDGQISDATWTEGRFGAGSHALSFPGSGAYVNMGSDAVLDLADAITISAWVNSASAGQSGHIVNRGGGWSDPGYSLFWHSNDIRIELQRSGDKTTVDNSVPPTGNWHHVAFRWDARTGQIETYIGGQLQSSQGHFAGPIGTPQQDLYVGRNQEQGRTFDGAIDDVAIFSHSLSPAQMRGLAFGAITPFDVEPAPDPIFGISVGPDGALEAFNARPAPEDGWATVAVPGGSTTHLNADELDATVQTLDAQLIGTQVGQSGTWTPSDHRLARWNTTAHALQTRPTGVAATVVMGTLENQTGAPVDDLHVWYDFGSWNLQTEDVYNHRTFYSLTGEPDSWQLIDEFSPAAQASEPGATRLYAQLDLGAWAPGDPLYILWADDNAQGSDTAYTINNFGVSTRPPSWPTVEGDSVLTMSDPADTDHADYFANWTVGTDENSTGRIELTGGHTFEAGSLRLVARESGNTAPHLAGVSGENTWTGPVAIGESDGILGTIESAAGSRLTLTGDVYSSNHINNRQLWLGGDGDGVLSGDIAANIARVRKYGEGTWVLTGDNAQRDRTIIDEGTLQVGAGGNTGTLGTGRVYINASLRIDRSGHLDIPGALYGEGSVVQTGGGTVSLVTDGNDNFRRGNWLVQDGSTLRVTTQSRIPGRVTLDDGHLVMTTTGETSLHGDRRIIAGEGGGTIDLINPAGTLRIRNDNRLTGSGDLALVGSGTLRVDNNINFSGDWYLYDGTLRVTTQSRLGANNISGGQQIVFDGGALRFSEGDTTINSARTFVVEDGGGTLRVDSRVRLETTDQVQGTGTLARTGSGELRIYNAQPNFTGTWDLQAGTMRIYDSSDRLGGAGSNVLFNGGTLALSSSGTALDPTQYFTVGNGGGTFDTSHTLTLGADNQLRGDGTLTKTNSGTLLLAGDHTFAGTMVVDAGTLQIGAGGGTGSPGTADIVNHAALVVDRSGELTLGQVISGTGTLTKRGPGTLTLAGENTYGGETAVSEGTLRLAHARALQNSTLTTGGVEFDQSVAGAAFTLGGLSGSGSIALENNAGAPIELAVGQNADDTAFSGALSGSGGLAKAGRGTLTLAGTNTYAGHTHIRQGALALAGTGALPGWDQPGSYTVHPDAVLAVDNAQFDAEAGAMLDTGNFQPGSRIGRAFRVDSGSMTAGTAIGDVAHASGIPTAMVKTGEGTLVLAADNTHSGDTVVGGGTLRIGDGGTRGWFGPGGVRNHAAVEFNRSDTVVLDAPVIEGSGTVANVGSGTLRLEHGQALEHSTVVPGGIVFGQQVGDNRFTFGGLAGSTNLALANEVGDPIELTLGPNDADTTYDGELSGGGRVVKVGEGTFRAPENHSHGGWVLKEGTVSITTQSRLGGSGAEITFDGGALEFTGGNTSVDSDRRFYVEDGGGQVTVANEVRIDNDILYGTGTLAVGPGAGVFRMEGANMSNFNGTWHLLEGGYLRVRSNTRIGGNDSSVLFDGGRLRIDNSTTLTGNRYFEVTDAGGMLDNRDTFTLGTANQVRGTGTLAKVSGGELRIEASQPNFTGTWELRGGTMRIWGDSSYIGGEGANVLFNGGTFRLTASSTALDPTQYMTVGDGGGTLRLGGYALTLGADDQLRGSGTLALSHDGTLVLSGDNSFDGTLTGEGAVYLNSPLALPHATVDLARGAVEFGGADAYTLGGLGGGGDVDVVLENAAHQPVALTVGDNDRSTAFAGRLSGSGSLIKTGSGTLALAGKNTYTGTTTVQAGTLEVLSSLANNTSADVLVASAGTEFDGSEPGIVRRVGASGTSLEGLGSQVIGPGTLGTRADLPAATEPLGGPLDVGMAWRMFAPGETQQTASYLRPVSDVLRLDGMEIDAATSAETDPFVLQMSYDSDLAARMPGAESWLHLAWLDPAEDLWVNAVDGNFGMGTEVVDQYGGSWDDFVDDYSGDLAAHLGSWGVDATNAVAWAVLDHNSQFGILVPEPGTWLMLLWVLACGLMVRRRRK